MQNSIVLKDARSKINASWKLILLILSTALLKSSQRRDHALSTAGPTNNGAPNKTVSSTSTRWNERRVPLWTLNPRWVISSHLDVFKIRPSSSHSFMILFETSSATTFSGPPNDKSSKKPRLKLASRDWSNGWIVLQKSSGPSGSPCWGPSWENTK